MGFPITNPDPNVWLPAAVAPPRPLGDLERYRMALEAIMIIAETYEPAYQIAKAALEGR